MNEPIEESKEISTKIEGRGGFREGSGRKRDWFKERCRELACSHHFFTFAERVFQGDPIEPRACKTGIIYTEASVSDKVYLWDKLAGYGFGKPETAPLFTPAQSVANAEAALNLIRMMEDVRSKVADGGRNPAGDAVRVADREAEVQTPAPSDHGL